MRVRLLSVAAAVAMAFGTLTTSTVPAHAGTSPVLFGLIDRWKTEITHDENELNIQSGVVGLFQPWVSNQTKRDTVVRWFDWVRSRGAAPMLALQPPASVTLGNIAAGGQDSSLRPWADRMARWGHPILLRLFPEMNNRNHTYAPRTRGQTVRQFRAAWRHVVNLFRSRGASNVAFMWNPYRIYPGSTSLKALWPGARYVGWVALDGYNYADSTHPFTWPYAMLSSSVQEIRRLAPNKPLMIAEIGCNQITSKPDWISKSIPAMQKLGAKIIIWFNEEKEHNWRFDSSSSALRAARSALHAPSVTYAQRWSLSRIDQLVSTGQ